MKLIITLIFVSLALISASTGTEQDHRNTNNHRAHHKISHRVTITPPHKCGHYKIRIMSSRSVKEKNLFTKKYKACISAHNKKIASNHSKLHKLNRLKCTHYKTGVHTAKTRYLKKKYFIKYKTCIDKVQHKQSNVNKRQQNTKINSHTKLSNHPSNRRITFGRKLLIKINLTRKSLYKLVKAIKTRLGNNKKAKSLRLSFKLNKNKLKTLTIQRKLLTKGKKMSKIKKLKFMGRLHKLNLKKLKYLKKAMKSRSKRRNLNKKIRDSRRRLRYFRIRLRIILKRRHSRLSQNMKLWKKRQMQRIQRNNKGHSSKGHYTHTKVSSKKNRANLNKHNNSTKKHHSNPKIISFKSFFGSILNHKLLSLFATSKTHRTKNTKHAKQIKRMINRTTKKLLRNHLKKFIKTKINKKKDYNTEGLCNKLKRKFQSVKNKNPLMSKALLYLHRFCKRYINK